MESYEDLEKRIVNIEKAIWLLDWRVACKYDIPDPQEKNKIKY